MEVSACGRRGRISVLGKAQTFLGVRLSVDGLVRKNPGRDKALGLIGWKRNEAAGFHRRKTAPSTSLALANFVGQRAQKLVILFLVQTQCRGAKSLGVVR